MEKQTLGDYTLLEEMSRGSLGIDYLAEHRFLKTPALVKVLPQELGEDPKFMARLAPLNHPNLVKVLTVSCHEGNYFVAFERVEGERLAAREKPLEEEEALTILTQVASALDYAHTQQRAHLGLNPSTIFVGNEVRLANFGLASLAEPSLAVFPFLAPEQRRQEEASAPADVFAFGVLAYNLLTGALPEGIFPLPSELIPTLTHDWDALVTACLQSAPERRPESLLPLLEKEATSLREIEAEKEVAELAPKFVHVEPVRQEQPLHAMAAASAPVKVEMAKPKSVESATPPAMNPPKDEQFEKKLNSMLNRDPIVTQYNPEVKEIKNIEPIASEQALIPGGYYFRGSNEGSRDESPRHKILVDAFAIDTHPVTNEQFVRFLEYMGSEKDEENNDLIRLKESRVTRSSGKLMIESGYTKHPVVGVTWYGAVAYASWVGKRLPTEAEWEVAAQGGLGDVVYSTGETIEKSQANFFSSDTTAVKSYPPTAYGLYDMTGNVYEWCEDWYSYNYYETSEQEPENPKGPIQGVYRVLRGGCWKSLREDLRCAHRHRNNPGTVNGTYGFRCASDA